MVFRHHPVAATVAGIGNAISMVIVPVYILRILPAMLPFDLSLDLEALERVIITIGGAATVFAALTAFYSKGILWRAAFGSARQGARLAWIHYILNGGLFSLDISSEEFGTGSIFVDFSGLLYILYAGILLMALYFVGEFAVYREARLEEGYS
jgi:hypothetical protein